MSLMLSEIASIVNGQLQGNDLQVQSVSINTRTLQPGELYCAIKGIHFDGNDFIQEAEVAGAQALIVSRQVQSELPKILVKDTRLALAEMAALWRRKLPVRLVAITGSNGKTTVKEMTAAILGTAGKVLYTQGNLNNDIGVPLTLMRLSEADQFAVIEMGANHPGEIAFTSKLAKPDIVLINNVGPAHLEGFGSVEGIAKAKGEIIDALPENGLAILNFDDAFYEGWKARAGNRKVLSFGFEKDADVRAINIETGFKQNHFQTRFELSYDQFRIPIELNLAGHHNVKNALAAASVGIAMGIQHSQMQAALESISPVTGRLQPLVAQQGGLVIDDTYNANAASLKAALDVLLECPGEPWVALGAFGELGKESDAIHEQMGEMIREQGVERLFATGSMARYTVRSFGSKGSYFEHQQELIEALKSELTGKQALLVKGSRAEHMEKVVGALVENFRN